MHHIEIRTSPDRVAGYIARYEKGDKVVFRGFGGNVKCIIIKPVNTQHGNHSYLMKVVSRKNSIYNYGYELTAYDMHLSPRKAGK